MKRLGLLCLLMLALLVPCAQAQGFAVQAGGESLILHPIDIEGERWLFLPSFADAEALGLRWLGEDAESPGVRLAETAEGERLNVMQSAHLRTLFLFSADPVNEGRDFIEDCDRHENETTGSMVLVDVDGRISHSDALTQIRGRGNSSWTMTRKKPYQFKLETKADLLRTGDGSEKNITWVLLADAMDPTMLHNRIALDLGHELGLSETSHAEHVDLYYDGVYCGLYLLSEKVEIGEGRLQGRDYDLLLEIWNDAVGQTDLSQLPVGQGVSEGGSTFSFIQGVADGETVNAGAYLMELENPVTTLSDRCYITFADGTIYSAKNPENPSEAMMRYITQRMEEARKTLDNGGVNPDNGRTIEQDFDLDAFARVLLIGQVAYNRDVYGNSSSWFLLPEGDSRFRPGGVWDYDLSWMYLRRNINAEGQGVIGESWSNAFYQCPAFVKVAQQVYREELYPLITDVLLGETHGAYLKPLDAYVQEIRAAWHMNRRLWGQESYGSSFIGGDTLEESIALLRSFAAQRNEWLYDALMHAREDAEYITLYGSADYLNVADSIELAACPWSHATVVSHTAAQLSQATETEYALWQLDVVLAPMEGYRFIDPQVDLHGTVFKGEVQADGTLHVRFAFADPSYRPVDYYGEDIGLVYNYDQYLANHPEVVALCAADDPQAVMDYFCDEGMYQDHMGNGFFRPSDVLELHPELSELLGEDWQQYYWEFIAYGHADGWLSRYTKTFPLKVAGE